MATSPADNRKLNLQTIVNQWGGPSTLAKKLRYKGPSYISQMLSANRPISEKTARKIEATLGLDPGSLDREPDSPAPTAAVALDASLVGSIILALGAACEDAHVKLTHTKLADIVTLVYEQAAATGKIDEKYLRRLIKLLN